jgi:hypothetical protein
MLLYYSHFRVIPQLSPVSPATIHVVPDYDHPPVSLVSTAPSVSLIDTPLSNNDVVGEDIGFPAADDELPDDVGFFVNLGTGIATPIHINPDGN